MMIKGASLRFRIAAALSIAALLLSALLILNNIYAIQTLRGDAAQSYRTMTALRMEETDAGLAGVERFLQNTLAVDHNALTLSHSEDRDALTFAAVELQRLLSSALTINPLLSSLFAFRADAGLFFDVCGSDTSYAERSRLRRRLQEALQALPAGGLGTEAGRAEASAGAWLAKAVVGEYYLFRVFRNGPLFLGAWLAAGACGPGRQRPLLHSRRWQRSR
jgi:hypothetical protein